MWFSNIAILVRVSSDEIEPPNVETPLHASFCLNKVAVPGGDNGNFQLIYTPIAAMLIFCHTQRLSKNSN
jgi:hypothetical protein